MNNMHNLLLLLFDIRLDLTVLWFTLSHHLFCAHLIFLRFSAWWWRLLPCILLLPQKQNWFHGFSCFILKSLLWRNSFIVRMNVNILYHLHRKLLLLWVIRCRFSLSFSWWGIPAVCRSRDVIILPFLARFTPISLSRLLWILWRRWLIRQTCLLILFLFFVAFFVGKSASRC